MTGEPVDAEGEPGGDLTPLRPSHDVVTPPHHDDPTAAWLRRDGDAWCNLTGRVAAAGTATVVSEHGTAVLIDVGRRRYRRVPLEGGQGLLVDGVWVGFASFSLTPCGLVIGGEAWYRGTRVRLVTAGLDELWLQGDFGPEVLRRVMARRAPRAPGHPASMCRARYCVRRVSREDRDPLSVHHHVLTDEVDGFRPGLDRRARRRCRWLSTSSTSPTPTGSRSPWASGASPSQRAGAAMSIVSSSTCRRVRRFAGSTNATCSAAAATEPSGGCGSVRQPTTRVTRARNTTITSCS